MDDVVATVLLVTYNHEAFIEESLEGVLTQETDFDYEVIISEDYSTDRTREIIEEVARSHPERVRLILSPHNLNDNSVVRRGIEAARGRYLALLDGDDRWTRREKLQTQVDFLESHPDCSMCFHNARVVYDDGRPSHPFLYDDPSRLKFKPKPLSTLDDIVKGTFIPACSAVFRTEHIREFPDWYDGLAAGDQPLHVFAAEHGYLAYIDEVMADYRVHAGGVWTARAQYRELADAEAVVEVYDAIDKHLDFQYSGVINELVANFYRERAIAYYRGGQYAWASTCARRSVARLPARRRPLAVKRVGLAAVAGIRSRLPA